MTLLSSTVSAWQQALATQYNNARKDILLRAWDLVTTTGSANAYLLAIDAQFTTYATGDTFVFKANFSNTASCTININSAWVKTFRDTDWDTLWAWAIQSWAILECVYDWTDMIIKSGLNYANYYNFGSGVDGNVTISTPTTLTRDMHYYDLTVNSDLDPAGFAIHVLWTISWTWKILRNGNTGTAWANGTNGTWGNGWAWGAALATWTCGVNYGWWGGGSWTSWGTAWNGVNGASSSPSFATTATAWASWWIGWTGNIPWGTWWTGGTATQGIYANTILSVAQVLSLAMYPGRWFSDIQVYGWLPWSGWGGGWDGTWGTSWGWGGGWAWGNGGNIFIAAKNWSWTWTIESKWWTWGNGWAAFATGSDAGGGGGWAWGNGGIVTIISKSWTPWSRTLTWGTAWTWGARRLTGTAWANGSTGTVGQSILITV